MLEGGDKFMLTVFCGKDATDEEKQALSAYLSEQHGEVECYLIEGGQDVYLLENGDDYRLTTVSMPPGVPVATVGINNGKNAAVLCGEILSIDNPEIVQLLDKLKDKKINL